MLDALPDQVSIYEVSPRDGLQNEALPIPLEGKKQLISALIESGLKRIELTSFVSPRWVPQLADAEELALEFRAPPGVTLSALCPNAKGFERAHAAGLQEIAVFMSASETHNKKNTNKSIAESLDTFREVVPPALAAKMRVRAYVSTVWGCPYEGDVDPRAALDITRTLLELGCYQVSLGDTIGVGTPLVTKRLVSMFLAEFSAPQLALHFHDTVARRSRMPWLVSSSAFGTSTRRWLAWAAARTRRAPRGISRPRTWSTCCKAWASGPESIWTG
jgi:hydroxymethylglutaryl-CoA lyase